VEFPVVTRLDVTLPGAGSFSLIRRRGGTLLGPGVTSSASEA
jgi:hypothetical protein